MKEQFSKFENEIIKSFAAPNASERLKSQLKAQIETQPKVQPSYHKPGPRFSFGWGLALASTLLVLIVVLAIGPGKVWAQIQKSLGFLPGFGLVEENTIIRTIAQPVGQSQDGITIDVVNALLTNSETKIDYRVFGLGKANFGEEGDPTCFEPAQLILPDGTVLTRDGNIFPAIPAGVEKATLIFPCIAGTRVETTPVNWQFELTFIPAENPQELLAVEFIPQPIISLSESEQTQQDESPDVDMGLGMAIETADGYILTGYLDSQKPFSYLAIDPVITDANQQIVQTTYPGEFMQLAQEEPLLGKADIFALAFKNQGLNFPLIVSWDYYPITRHTIENTPVQTFNVGDNPQVGQSWQSDLVFEIDGISITLKKIAVERNNAYRFTFEGPGNLETVSVEMPDYPSIGGGGGSSGYPSAEGTKEAESSISFTDLPTGELKFYVTAISVYEEPVRLTQSWQPSQAHAQSQAQTDIDVCLVGSQSSQIKSLPTFAEELLILGYAQIPGTSDWETRLLSSTGLTPNEVFRAANRSSFSLDGKQIIYPGEQNDKYVLEVFDIATSRITTLPYSSSDFQFSPDGKYILMSLTDSMVLYPALYNVETQTLLPISADEYVDIVGWSPDSKTAYFAVRYTEGLAWKFMAYSVETGKTEALLDITNGTIKLLYPRVSPDGKWLSYRGSDNSTIWLMNLETQETRKLMDASNVRAAIWLDETHLAMNLTDETGTYHLLVADINSCNLMRVDGIQTEVMDVTLAK